MALRPLPPELISLVHHIELNRSGWWEKAVQQLLIAAVWLSGKAQTAPEIVVALRDSFQVEVDVNKAASHLARLCSSGVLVCMPGGSYKIAESFLKKYEADFQQTEAVERAVEALFLKLIGERCPSLDAQATWQKFNEQFLLPFIREVGANTYKLLSEGNLQISPARFERFLRSYPPETHTAFAEAVETFLDPKNLQVRAFILRSLNAYFFIEASSLREETLDAIIRVTGSSPTFNIFVDTNFLFSILGLIPSAEDSGQSLVDLIKRLSGKVTVRLYALPSTLDEAKHKLIAIKQSLSGVRVVPNLAEAALRMNLDGLQLKFFEESRRRGLISADEYFEPYISDLTTVMRAKGVELFNEDVSQYKMRADVIDDISIQLKIEKRRYKERAKNYEKLEHDMILWHCARDKRPIRIESPLEAKYWVVTIDYRMLGFDKFKKKALKGSAGAHFIPICLYPTTLIQMLQFWVPRTPEFEEAVLNSMRLPFLYQEFDHKAEKVTLDILKTLGRYENVGDLPTDTVSSVLVNSALRQKMSVEKEVNAKANLVREALIEQHTQTRNRLEEIAEQLRAKERALDDVSAGAKLKEQELAEQIAERERDKAALLEQMDAVEASSRSEKDVLEGRITQLEEAALARDHEQTLQKLRRHFLLRWLAAPITFSCLVVLALGFLISKAMHLGFWRTDVAIWSLALILWASLFHKRGMNVDGIKDWNLFLTFSKVKNWLFGLLWILLTGLLVNYIYELFKSRPD